MNIRDLLKDDFGIDVRIASGSPSLASASRAPTPPPPPPPHPPPPPPLFPPPPPPSERFATLSLYTHHNHTTYILISHYTLFTL